MPTEKGRSARIKAEKEAAKAPTPLQSALDCFVADRQAVVISDAWQKAYVDKKYARREKLTRKSYESHLPVTHKLPAEQIKERIGDRYREWLDPLGTGFREERVQKQQARVAKKHLNGPDIPPDIKRQPRPGVPYDPTRAGEVRDGKRRPSLPDTTDKAKNTADPAVARRAWKELDEKTRTFVKLKSK